MNDVTGGYCLSSVLHAFPWFKSHVQHPKHLSTLCHAIFRFGTSQKSILAPFCAFFSVTPICELVAFAFLYETLRDIVANVENDKIYSCVSQRVRTSSDVARSFSEVILPL
jgi:hypothetical protein